MNIPARRFQPGEMYYGDWFPRMADNVILRGQVIYAENDTPTSTVTVTLLTKNSDEAGDGTEVEVATSTPYKLELNNTDEDREVQQVVIISTGTAGRGLKELLRYKVEAPSSGAWILARVFDPVFFDSSKPA